MGGREDRSQSQCVSCHHRPSPTLSTSFMAGDGFSDNETIMVRLSFTGLLQLPRVMGLLSKPTPISPSFRPPPTLSSLNTKNKGQSSHFIGLQRSLSSKNDYTKSFMMQARKGGPTKQGVRDWLTLTGFPHSWAVPPCPRAHSPLAPITQNLPGNLQRHSES